MVEEFNDWGKQSIKFDEIKDTITGKDIQLESEAQTRFDIIDRLIREVLGWKYGQISVEERQELGIRGYVDYKLIAGDITIVIEAKKVGVAFPSPTRVKQIKRNSTLLQGQAIANAIQQAAEYSKSKIAQVTVVTNGLCWCFFKTDEFLSDPEAKINLLYPFDDIKDAEDLFRILGNGNVSKNGLKFFNNIVPQTSGNKLLAVVRDSEMRVGRNNVADFIAPAIDRALYAEAIINNPSRLKDAFVYTAARTKFDSTLQIHLADTKPVSILPAPRVRSGQSEGELETLIKNGGPVFAPPVTLLIAEVGVGKSTYLRHFELVYAKELLETKKAHWVYIDFESMGKGGNVRSFIYRKLNEYLLDGSKSLKTDYESVIEPAYRDEVESLKRGPFA